MNTKKNINIWTVQLSIGFSSTNNSAILGSCNKKSNCEHGSPQSEYISEPISLEHEAGNSFYQFWLALRRSEAFRKLAGQLKFDVLRCTQNLSTLTSIWLVGQPVPYHSGSFVTATIEMNGRIDWRYLCFVKKSVEVILILGLHILNRKCVISDLLWHQYQKQSGSEFRTSKFLTLGYQI